MSDTPTAAELETVVQAAADHIRRDDFQGAYDLLEPLHESDSLAGALLGRAAYLLGEACLGLQGFDAAMYYYEQATQLGEGEARRNAAARIQELQRLDDAVDAVGDGVAGDEEADAVLDAAEQALARDDYELAFEYFTHAYNAIQMTSPQLARAAVGLAECRVRDHDIEQAEGYLQIAESADASQLTDQIANVRSRIASLESGAAAADGSIDLDEFDEINAAALAAYASTDFETAFRYWEQMYQAEGLAAVERGRVAANLGICCLYTHDYDAAHQYFTEAASTARPDIANRANEIIAELANADDAAEIVARLDPMNEIATE